MSQRFGTSARQAENGFMPGRIVSSQPRRRNNRRRNANSSNESKIGGDRILGVGTIAAPAFRHARSKKTRRPGQAKVAPGPITTGRGIARIRSSNLFYNVQRWLWVPAFALVHAHIFWCGGS